MGKGPTISMPHGGIAFWALAALIVAAFLLGGSARDDVLGLAILRPVAAICLGIGLFMMTGEAARHYRWPLIALGAVVLLTLIHLIPLPPSLWMALPGRELAAEAARAGGIEQPWRPIALVPWRGWNALFALMIPAAAMLLAISCDAQQQRRLAVLVLIMVAVSVAIGAVQVAGGYREILYIYRISSLDVPTGLYANRNHFAVILCCALPLLVLLAAPEGDSSRSGSLKMWLAGVAGAVGLLLLLLSGSRQGLLLAVVAIGAAPLLYRKGRRHEISLRRRRLLILGVVALALMLMIAFAIYFARAEAINRLIATDESEELRFNAWGPIFELVRHYLPVGSGVGSFVEVFYAGEPHELLKPSYLNHAHNDWLEWLLETGVPGLLLALAAIAGWVLRSLRLVRMPRGGERGVGLAIAGAVIILLLGLASIVDYPVRVPSVACLLALAAVWMAAPSGRKGSGTA
ncbi:O-antigen ligase family protein [Sphingomonas sp. MS122]|uniref:O-antigen ligase family protein n=1 Tax=Sphingomonas sp. MS122 TaxID=3412683 RepID=UPI003C2E1F17